MMKTTHRMDLCLLSRSGDFAVQAESENRICGLGLDVDMIDDDLSPV